jgi:sirohydrochlorin cobaltochelatase
MTLSSSAPNGIILFAHGSRDPLWRGPIEAVAQRIGRDHPQLLVSCAYLELCEPSLASAAAEMVKQLKNATNLIANYQDLSPPKSTKPLKIRILPMFFGMGKHAREDLPLLAQELRSKFAQVEFEIAATVGEDTRVTALLAQIATGASNPEL